MKNIISVLAVIVGLLLAAQVFAGQAVKAPVELKQAAPSEDIKKQVAPMKKEEITGVPMRIQAVKAEGVVAPPVAPTMEPPFGLTHGLPSQVAGDVSKIAAFWCVIDAVNRFSVELHDDCLEGNGSKVWIVGTAMGPELVSGIPISIMNTMARQAYEQMYQQSLNYFNTYVNSLAAASAANQILEDSQGQYFFVPGTSVRVNIEQLDAEFIHMVPQFDNNYGPIVIYSDSPYFPVSLRQ